MDRIEKRSNDLKNRMDRIELKLDLILSELQTVKRSSDNMDRHIDKIDGVYRQVKQPFHGLMDMASNFLRYSDAIEYSD